MTADDTHVGSSGLDVFSGLHESTGASTAHCAIYASLYLERQRASVQTGRALSIRPQGRRIRHSERFEIIAINRKPEEVATLLQAAGAPTNELHLSIQPLLVRSGEKVLLFDTGAGTSAGDTAGKLMSSMKEAGVDPSTVTDIFISHAHRDHIGGLFTPNGLAFENAAVHMSALEWDSVKASAGEDAERAAMITALESKLTPFEPGADLIPGVVKAVDIQGHTPGHSGYLISSNSESLLYIGDTAHHYVVSVQEPNWTIQFDRDAPTAEASRKAMIETNANSDQLIYAVHFPFPGLGTFEAEGERFVWRAKQ